MESVLEEAIRKGKKLRLVGNKRTGRKKISEAISHDEPKGISETKKCESVHIEKTETTTTSREYGSCDVLFGNGKEIDEKAVVKYLLSTVYEVIEISRRPVPVLDKSGQPTGNVEYQSATVLKACELMAKLMGSIKEEEGKGVSVQIVSYRDEQKED